VASRFGLLAGATPMRRNALSPRRSTDLKARVRSKGDSSVISDHAVDIATNTRRCSRFTASSAQRIAPSCQAERYETCSSRAATMESKFLEGSPQIPRLRFRLFGGSDAGLTRFRANRYPVSASHLQGELSSWKQR
jgi:hypothetical protein